MNNGDAFILAAPELNTKSGGTASFLAGGQVPIPQSGALGTTNVMYKDYGVKLSINPVVDANGIISAHLTTEISQIDPTVSYGGLPGFLTRSTSSDISMRTGETLAISGLISADSVNDSDGMPFLGQIPVIGQLFRSDSFRAKKSDLVIFVTPLISDPELAPNADLLTRADGIDRAYVNQYGNPEPLIADEEKAARTSAARQPIQPTPALQPAPIRSTSPIAPADRAAQSPNGGDVRADGAAQAAQLPSPAVVVESQAAPAAPALRTSQTQRQPQAQSRPQPQLQPQPASTPPEGVAEALRMLNAAEEPPTAPSAPRDASPSAANGKVPPQQVGVLGSAPN
ncbi:hypothetical protein BUPH_01434 [Paraburkholderia phenoliruptrix BR3459a]|uniref:Type II/III secretion system secretin-like domain-containing protein n=1 Tax=Paraburkholderia phenoliruptrix BR3459a TaxID=1229205 RepID=K0DXW0_9BURK|nr:hypothetical protein BUPH_01434 [Paraburkholderia phenoliruptrix BR3459a]